VIETISRLLKLQHSNGRPVVEIYGNCGVIMEHMKNKCFIFDPSSDELKGSIVSLNVLRSDGSCVGYNEVSKLAALNAIPIQFRTGCFCNPGGCQDALKLDEDRVKRNYLTNKKVCGDHIDIIDGLPTGAVRISVGKDSIWEDIDTFICFIEQTFRDNGIFMRHAVHEQIAPDNRTIPRYLKLEEVYVFPIKSCAGAYVFNLFWNHLYF
jgi:molybdenum cofactor sulfurtransferase